jgi:hypothetical protein
MRPHGKYAVVDPTDPEAFAQCDRCGFWRNRSDLVWQTGWAGQHIYNIQVLVCKERCFDTPNEQLRTIVLPPDPPPIINARPPNFTYEESGPVQSTLASDVLQGAILLPVVSATGFQVGDTVLVQLDNGAVAQMPVTGVDLNTNVLSVLYPMPFSAAYTNAVSVQAPNG